jgi:hypothetical protein
LRIGIDAALIGGAATPGDADDREEAGGGGLSRDTARENAHDFLVVLTSLVIH